MTIGNLSSFVLYSRRFSGPINEVANIISELQSACAAAERVFRLIDEEAEPADAIDAVSLDKVEGDVAMEHVKFGYDPGKTIIHDLSFQAPKGSLTAIVGPHRRRQNYADQLADALLRPGFRRHYFGRPGHPEDHPEEPASVPNAMVLQDTWLFSGTIFENLAYGKKDAKLEDVQRAAKAAHIHRYIMGLPKGYDTQLDENGMNISQGQKQLLNHCPGHAAGRKNADLGRGHFQRGHPHGDPDPGGHAGADEG